MKENEILIRIANHQNQIAELETELATIRREQTEEETLQNTYDTLFDGLKFTNTQETAIEIRMPMYYRAKSLLQKDNRRHYNYICLLASRRFNDWYCNRRKF